MELRARLLKTIYRLFPFPLGGDIQLGPSSPDLDLSCVINFFGRINLLEGILYSLAEQDFPKERFEVVLIEDRGGTDEGRSIAQTFEKMLNIRYFPLQENFGKMGFSRNYGLLQTRGKYLLLLDDDTVILQKEFLSTLLAEFDDTRADGIVPFGSASYCLLKGRYSFHDPYFPTSRCMAYRREVLDELGGFVSDIVGQEDVEFVIRFVAASKRFFHSEHLAYFHPPLILDRMEKAASVGVSFAKLRRRYPFLIWLMLLLNGSRYLPLSFFPITTKWNMQSRFSRGFMLGIIYSMIGKEAKYQ